MAVWLCPECKAGRTGNCRGWTFDDRDREVSCAGLAQEFRIVWGRSAGLRLAGLRVEHTPTFASADAAECVRRGLRSADLCEVVVAA